jgi:hypothetical protein
MDPNMRPVFGLCHGASIVVQGYILPNANRFSINLCCGPNFGGCDTALHINPRFDEGNVVVRNTFMNGAWGGEERDGPRFHLQRGQTFECMILIQHDIIRVAFNGQHYFEFRHRLAKERISHVVLRGDVQLQNINFYGTAGAPGRQMIPGGLYKNRMIHITGTPGPTRFAVNLRLFESGGDIAFHFNPRMAERVVVRNSNLGGSWGHEERDHPPFPFAVGYPFQMTILVKNHKFKVAVNGSHFIEYRHRHGHLPSIQWVEVTQDVSNTTIQIV